MNLILKIISLLITPQIHTISFGTRPLRSHGMVSPTLVIADLLLLRGRVGEITPILEFRTHCKVSSQIPSPPLPRYPLSYNPIALENKSALPLHGNGLLREVTTFSSPLDVRIRKINAPIIYLKSCSHDSKASKRFPIASEECQMAHHYTFPCSPRNHVINFKYYC